MREKIVNASKIEDIAYRLECCCALIGVLRAEADAECLLRPEALDGVRIFLSASAGDLRTIIDGARGYSSDPIGAETTQSEGAGS